MAKKKTEAVKRVVTKRALSNLQRQKRRNRLIRIFGIAVIVAVLALITSGLYFQWYLTDYKPLKEKVVEVNGASFDVRYFIDYLNISLGEYLPYVEYFLDTGLSNLERDALIKQKADAMGITVTDEEIKNYISENKLPDNQAARDIAERQLLVTKLQDDYFRPQFPSSADQRHALAMFLESPKQAEDIIARLNAGEDFGTIAGELSLESTTKTGKGDLGFRPKGIIDKLLNTTGLENAIFDAEAGKVGQPLLDAGKSKNTGYWLVKVLERDEEDNTVNVQGMLLPSRQAAEDALARLAKGEDFAALAEEVSQQGVAGTKAELGWLVEEDITQAFKTYVFDEATEIGKVSSPIADTGATTTGGYWVYKVVESATMDVSEENMGILVSNALSDWLKTIVEDPDNKITSYLNQSMGNFIVEKIAGYNPAEK